MKKRIFILFVILFGVVFYSCGKDCTDDQNPECPNYDPCKNFKKYPKGFQAFSNYYYAEDYDYDTVSTPDVYFRARFDAYEYKWIIGAGEYSGKQIKIAFPSSWINDTLNQNPQTVKVMLIQKRSINTRCFPNDDGIDTFIRYITFVDACQFKIKGKFMGKDTENPNTEYAIEISDGLCQRWSPFNPITNIDSSRTFYNFRNKGELSNFGGEYRYYKASSFGLTMKDPDKEAGYGLAKMHLPEYNSIVIKYSVIKPQFQYTTDARILLDSNNYNTFFFRGKRIY